MKKKKRYVVILVILAVYLILMFLIFGKYIEKGKYETTIIIGQDTIWNYSNRSWLNITSNSTIENLNWKKYNIYLDNKFTGKYYLWYNEKWYLFDENKNAITKDGKLLAFDSNYDIKVLDFSTSEIKDYSYIKKVLQENNLDVNSKFTVNNQIKLDIDNDQKTETIYVISNVFAIDFYPDTIFSIVFMEKEGKIYNIYQDIDKNYSTNGCKPYINTIFDIDSDDKYEIVLSCGRYSINKPIDMLYQLEDKEFKILISNQ